LLLILSTSIVRDHQHQSEIDDLKGRIDELLLLKSEADVRGDDLRTFAAYQRRLNPMEILAEATETATEPTVIAPADPPTAIQGTAGPSIFTDPPTVTAAQAATQLEQDSFTHAINYGVVGDSIADDTEALQSAIDDAASNESAFGGGGTVILPKGIFLTTAPLIIPGGVTVTGQGYGSSPLAIQFDAGGSVIAYCGTDYAVKLDGHAASLNNVAVYDWRYPVGSACDNMKAKGGVLLDANGKLLESITMSNVLIYWFMGGTSLTLRARNNGGVAFNNFQNIRVRHAHTGISLEAEEGSFVK
jgi:hypothetical protein